MYGVKRCVCHILNNYTKDHSCTWLGHCGRNSRHTLSPCGYIY